MKFTIKILTVFALLVTPIIFSRDIRNQSQNTKESPTKITGPCATIFIHGTIVPLFSPIKYLLPNRKKGLVNFHDCDRRDQIIAKTLQSTRPKEYSCDSFYVYNWSGLLSFYERKKAAEDLYQYLIEYKGHVTLVAHSHGASVVFYLAEIAQKKGNSFFLIDRLILFAPPVQAATAHHIKSPIFKEIISFYSSADIGQIIDPQGLYEDTKKASTDDESYSLLSQRTFKHSSNLIQARVLLNMQSPGHSDFLAPRFLSRLPAAIEFLTKTVKNTTKRHFILNILPRQEEVQLIKRRKLVYIPRTIRCCRCRL